MGYTTLKHIANSDAILLDPIFHLDMVRLGIGLYGTSQGPLALEPVIQLTTTISQIRHLKREIPLVTIAQGCYCAIVQLLPYD